MYIEKMKEKNLVRTYAHFDKRMSIDEVAHYIIDEKKIATHSFLPFIRYIKRFYKYDGKKKSIKEREISYSSHMDRYIYQLYSLKLNEYYNVWIDRNQLDMVSIAYRTNLGRNNIDFSYLAFEFIKRTANCFVIIGDFTNFFDTLEHKYLI